MVYKTRRTICFDWVLTDAVTECLCESDHVVGEDIAVVGVWVWQVLLQATDCLALGDQHLIVDEEVICGQACL